jgi:hypothetical protein
MPKHTQRIVGLPMGSFRPDPTLARTTKGSGRGHNAACRTRRSARLSLVSGLSGSRHDKCPECDGWTGTTCPHGCGVRLISTQAEDDIAFRERMREEEAERRRYRAERKAAREAEEQR